jgi:hypothetical protein
MRERPPADWLSSVSDRQHSAATQPTQCSGYFRPTANLVVHLHLQLISLLVLACCGRLSL